jgi:4-hydroxybenzoate polyprenyltransferase
MLLKINEVSLDKKYNIRNGSDKPSFRLIKNKIFAYIIASRLPGFLISAIFFLLGQLYSFSFTKFLIFPSVLMFLFILLISAINGLTNMVFDKKLDIFARKTTIWVFQYISSKEMLFMSFILSIVSLGILLLFNQAVFITGLVYLIATVIYVMPPIRLKIHPPFDSIDNGLFMATLPFLLGWLVIGDKFTLLTIIYGTIMGMSAATYYLLNSLTDFKTDKEFGIKTSSIKLGYQGTLNVCPLLFIVIIILSIVFFSINSIITISFIICLPLLVMINIIGRKIKVFKRKVQNVIILTNLTAIIWSFFVLIGISIFSFSPIPIFLLIISSIFYFSTFIRPIIYKKKLFLDKIPTISKDNK